MFTERNLLRMIFNSHLTIANFTLLPQIPLYSHTESSIRACLFPSLGTAVVFFVKLSTQNALRKVQALLSLRSSQT